MLENHLVVGILHSLAVQISGERVNPTYRVDAISLMLQMANISKQAYNIFRSGITGISTRHVAQIMSRREAPDVLTGDFGSDRVSSSGPYFQTKKRAVEWTKLHGPQVRVSILFDATKLCRSIQYSHKLNAIVGGPPPYSIVYLDEDEGPEAAMTRVKRLLGLEGLYGDEFDSRMKQVVSSEILIALLTVQTPVKGAPPFFLLKARPQRTNGKSDFQHTLISLMTETFGRRFLGPAADGADSKLISDLIKQFLNGSVHFIAQQGLSFFITYIITSLS